LPFSTKDSFAMLAEYHRVHLKRWHLVFQCYCNLMS
jgi:hypothetical protein